MLQAAAAAATTDLCISTEETAMQVITTRDAEAQGTVPTRDAEGQVSVPMCDAEAQATVTTRDTKIQVLSADLIITRDASTQAGNR